MRVWPMLVFAAAMVIVGIVLVYVMLIGGGRVGYGSALVMIAPFALAIAAVSAVREEAADQFRRASEERARYRRERGEKLAPHPVEPAARGGVDEGPFRTAPKPAPIVARVALRADTDAPIVPGDDEPPKLLT